MNNTVLKKAIIKVIGIAGVAVFSSSLQAASFDCAQAAAPIEKLICSDETTSKLDVDLAGAYKSAMEKAENKDELKQQQRAWLKEKRNVCKDSACLTQVYQERIAVLNGNEQLSDGKRPVSFKLVYGDSYPICQPYIDMLNAAKYAEAPVCERKLLPGFSQFSAVKWKEITDKGEMKKIFNETFEVELALDYRNNPYDMGHSKTYFFRSVDADKIKMYFYEIDINNDNVKDVVYMTSEKKEQLEEFGLCGFHNSFHVKDSKITLENITEKTVNPYKAFNFGGSNDLFIFSKQIYSSHWNGKILDQGSNLDIYEVGNKKICGILVK